MPAITFLYRYGIHLLNTANSRHCGKDTMNFQQLQYAVEIAKTGSISAAAKNLFMGQPNLSKSIKELEEETGIVIFHRTSKGVQLTKSGQEFIGYAQTILKQVEKLESLYNKPSQSLPFGFSAPRAAYISSAFCSYMGSTADRPRHIYYQETNPASVIQDVASGISELGIVRFEPIHGDYYMGLIKENLLEHMLIKEYHMVVLMSRNHPLSAMDIIPVSMLHSCTRILQGDINQDRPELRASRETSEHHSCISVYDRGSQFDFLRHIPGSYMWVSPVPQEELERHGLIQRPCSLSPVCRDIVVYHAGSRFLSLIRELTKALRQAAGEFT